MMTYCIILLKCDNMQIGNVNSLYTDTKSDVNHDMPKAIYYSSISPYRRTKITEDEWTEK